MKELCKTKNSLLRVSQRAGSLQRPAQGWHSVLGEMLIGFLECTSQRILGGTLYCRFTLLYLTLLHSTMALVGYT